MRPARVGLLCACVGLLAAPAARADSVMLTGGSFGMSPARFTMHRHEEGARKPDRPIPFSFCKHCDAPESSAHMRNADVMEGRLPDFGEGLSAGVSSSLGGAFTLPVPAMSDSPSASSPVVTLPFQSSGTTPAVDPPSTSLALAHTTFSSVLDPASGGTAGPSGFVAQTLAADPPSPTPEPATLLLLGLGFAAVGVRRAWKPRT